LILSWMVQSRPERVASAVFIDPVCFQTHLVKLVYNFSFSRVDQRCEGDKKWANPFSIEAMDSLIGTEMHTSHALLRKFSWATNVLWPEDIERSGIPSYIVLSEDDQFVSTQDVVRMVPKETRDLIRTDVFCKSEHGGFLFEEEF